MALKDNLISYWKLDEASGNAADSQGTETLTSNGNTYGVGALGNAAIFSAAGSQYLSHSSDINLQAGNIDFSFTAWCNFTTKPANLMGILVKTLASNRTGDYLLYWDNSIDRFIFEVSANGGPAGSGTANNYGTIVPQVWLFVACTYAQSAGSVLKISVNAGNQNSGTVGTIAPIAGSDQFCLGAYSTPTNYFNGNIDEVGFWKRTLTTAEITQLYNNGTPLAFNQWPGGISGLQSKYW